MSWTHLSIPLASPAPGTSRHLAVHRFGAPGARPKAYLQASLHADEFPAMLVLHHLARRLIAAKDAMIGEILLVPCANPIGLAQQINGILVGRYELDGYGNFNRNWPDLSAKVAKRIETDLGDDPAANVALIRAAILDSLAEIEAASEIDSLRLALARLAADADYVLDLHCDREALVHLYTAPDLWARGGAELSAEIGSRASLLAEDSGGNSFDEAWSLPWTRLARRFGADHPVPSACFSATVELRGQSDVDDRLAALDAAGLFRFLQRRGVIAGDPGPLPEPLCPPTQLTAVDIVRTPKAGLVVYRKELGDQVAAGEVIADLVDPMAEDPGGARMPLRSRTDGLFFTRRRNKLARPGASVGKIAGLTSLAHRTGKLLSD